MPYFGNARHLQYNNLVWVQLINMLQWLYKMSLGVFAWIHMSLCLLTCIFLFSHILHLFPYPWFGFRLCQQHSIWFLNLLFTLCLAPAILFYLALIGYISQCTIFSLNLPCLVLYSSVLKYASIANTIKHA